MPDEPTPQEAAPQQPQQPDAAAPPDFDWGSFWGRDDDSGETPPAAVIEQAAKEEILEEDADTQVLKEVREMRKTTAQLAAKLDENERAAKVEKAIKAWEEQASPEERALSSVLYRSQSVEELKANEVVVRQAAAKLVSEREALMGEERKKIEREMQERFGLPVPPNFQPIPDADKAEQALADGDIDKAAAIYMKGLF
jgi:hypothetical protein